eukprot:sb/3474629/
MIIKSDFLKLSPPWVAREFFFCASESCFGSHAFVSRPIWSNQIFIFICASESCFGSHAFVSRPIWSNQIFKQVGAVTRKYNAARQRGVTTSKNPTLATGYLYQYYDVSITRGYVISSKHPIEILNEGAVGRLDTA